MDNTGYSLSSDNEVIRTSCFKLYQFLIKLNAQSLDSLDSLAT